MFNSIVHFSSLFKMNILQIPIHDEFSASSESKRAVEFAAEKGLWTQNPRRTPASLPANFPPQPSIPAPEVSV